MIILFVLPLIVLLWSRTLRRLAIRNALRRPRESALVVLGSLMATALMTTAFVVGDSFNSSIRQFAYTQLGPIDEIATVTTADDAALLRERLADFDHPDIDGQFDVTAFSVTAATLSGDEARTAAPRAQLLEVDFDDVTSQFDSDLSGISGEAPRGNRAVVVDQLADKLDIGPGDAFTVFSGGQQLELVVDRVVDHVGVAGLWIGQGTKSYNAIVEPGTIERFAATAATEAAPPTFSVAVSNRGGVEDSVAPSNAVAEAMRAAVGDLDAEVTTAKADLIEQADQQGDSLTQLYGFIGTFAVIAAILLMVNIFLMLAEERRSEMGMMRAMGLRRSRLIAGFAAEGWLYALPATVLGVVAGLGIARVLLVFAAKIFAGGGDGFSLDVIFSWTWSSLLSGAMIGFVIAMVTVIVTAVVTANFNVIAAIRGVDHTKLRKRRWPRVAWGTFRVALGAALFLGGLTGPNAMTLVAGLPVAISGGYGLFRVWSGPRRIVMTLAAGVPLAWSVLAVALAVVLDAELDPPAFIAQGVVGVAAAVALMTEYQSEIARAISRLSGRSLTVRLGLAYPLARRTRTAFTMGQFAIVVWILVYLSVLSHMFAGQVETLTAEISGGFNTLVKSNPSNPISDAELRQLPGVTKVAPMVQTLLAITPPGETNEKYWGMSAITEEFVAGGAPRLEATGEFADDEAAYRELLTNPNAVMIDSFFLSDGGPPASPINVGETITVKNPLNGRTKELTVIAESADDWLFNGGLMNPDAMGELLGAGAVANRAYVEVADPVAFSAALEADYFRQGAESDPIRDIVDENLAQQNQFFALMRSFLAIGLIIGVAGIGVIMIRAVRERRRQIGVLRALGFESKSVSNAFATEATFLALEGIVIGVVLAFVATWSITKSDDFGDGFTWRVPWIFVIGLVAVTLVGALLATFFPARSAAKIRPSVALRITD